MCITAQHQDAATLVDIHAASFAKDWRSTFPMALTLQSEISTCKAWELPPRLFSYQEMVKLLDDTRQALRIHDPDPVAHWFQYLLDFPHLIQYQDTKLLGSSIFLYGIDAEAYPVQFRDSTRVLKYFNFIGLVKKDAFGLSEHSIFVIQCVVGQLICRYRPWQADTRKLDTVFDEQCVPIYKAVKTAAQQGTVAFMGCFRRGSLPYVNRDVALLIAKLIFNPVEWAEHHE
jgi:hypothetical protein